MSTKHFFPSTDGLVNLALSSLAARNTHLSLDEANKVIYNTVHPRSRIALISGGGSGHEPAWSGYVGDGMLAASVSGEVFASPSTKQIMAAIDQVPSDEGVIMLITNYTGDQLHFGLAREKAAGMGCKVGTIAATDDVALGREKSQLVGRRGLAANLLVLKLVGAAAQQGWKFEQVLELGRQANAQMVTIGSSLDHCHIPGRTHHEAVPENACELGMGIHNEPGFRTISPTPAAETLVEDMLKYLLDPNDKDRAFTEFRKDDEVVLMVNNFGGLSILELEALTTMIHQQLADDWHIRPSRAYVGCFETSLNGPGFSISLGNLSGVSRGMDISSTQLFDLLDAPTTAPAWPKNGYTQPVAQQKGQKHHGANAVQARRSVRGPCVNATTFTKVLRTACQKALDAEPMITKYDQQMGDGDCGEAVALACKSVVAKLESGALLSDEKGSSLSLGHALQEISDSLEEIGGSLGAILSILTTAVTNALQSSCSDTSDASIEVLASALSTGMQNLQQYTSARKGDRTVMDTLIPFTESLQQSGSLEEAVHAAEVGAQQTAQLQPRFGRASYVGDHTKENLREDMPPDAGAFAAGVFLKGLLEGLNA